MGTGYGIGADRAVEAAQEAISSPLLDDVSIQGAAGVLINITGGMDLAIDEVTTINAVIQEAVGEEAEIIFGVVHDPGLDGAVRVTVVVTGFHQSEVVHHSIQPWMLRMREEDRLPRPQLNLRGTRTVRPASETPKEDLEIPAFIRRQMD